MLSNETTELTNEAFFKVLEVKEPGKTTLLIGFLKYIPCVPPAASGTFPPTYIYGPVGMGPPGAGDPGESFLHEPIASNIAKARKYFINFILDKVMVM